MKTLLHNLLNQVDSIGKDHHELYDSECREILSNAIWDGYVCPVSRFVLADDFGLYSPDANRSVRDALDQFIRQANVKADELGLNTFHARLAAFQDRSVHSDRECIYFDDVFGYWRPEEFDKDGVPIGDK